MIVKKQKALNTVLAAVSRPQETRRGNELSAQRLTVANQLIRGSITPAQAKQRMK
jgi:hypothetical protein